jgi:glutathione S-transferase
MLILRSSPTSPFGRKVKIAADVVGLTDKITVVPADTADPSDSLRGQNPLGKIPTLILADGSTLFDSRVIVEYLDGLAGGGQLIPPGEERFPVLRLAALADGICEAALLLVYEMRLRAEGARSAVWIEMQQSKIDRAIDAVGASPPATDGPLDAGVIGLACALGYLDLRHSGAWRARHQGLVAWLDAFSARCPAYERTRFTG